MKRIFGVVLALVGFGVFASVASAAIQQQVTGNTYPPDSTDVTATAKAGYVHFDSYLSTRDALSTRGTMKANPVGKVFMDFPTGGTINKASKPTCRLSEYAPPAALSRVPTTDKKKIGDLRYDGCSTSVIGTGWALLNSGKAVAHAQLTGAVPACPLSDTSQYARTWEDDAPAGPDCTPIGDYYVKIVAYQGGVLKAQWWCYGDAGAPKPGAKCNNKATGGDAKNTLLATGPTNGTFNDLTNKRGMNGCNIIFSNDNSLNPLAFGGTDTGCKNRLTVIIPALNACAECLGELTGGMVLSDFFLRITSPTYMKAPACPASKAWSVKTQIVFSKLKGETGAVPPSQTIPSTESCSK
jgi:hypothetical protein